MTRLISNSLIQPGKLCVFISMSQNLHLLSWRVRLHLWLDLAGTFDPATDTSWFYGRFSRRNRLLIKCIKICIHIHTAIFTHQELLILFILIGSAKTHGQLFDSRRRLYVICAQSLVLVSISAGFIILDLGLVVHQIRLWSTLILILL